MIKISCVSYLNSKPFIYGLQNSAINKEIDLQLDIPSECARKLQENVVDIGLVPIAALEEMEEHHIISDYCIGADGEVGSVLLASDVPLHHIQNILLDYQSRTSVILAQVLAEKFWKITPQFHDTRQNYESIIGGTTAGIIIGDRTFAVKSKFKYIYDLAHEWKLFTNLPFVFACWVANKDIDRDFVKRFNEALRFGLMNSETVVAEFKKETGTDVDVKDYLENKISYAFDERKKFAMELFLTYANEIVENEAMKII
ncbi:MAG: menaquinone biosynthesis protein [Bacteroidota bacterium]